MSLVIRDCAVLRIPDDGPCRVDREQDLLLIAGRVAALGPAGSMELPDGATVIEAAGLTAVPGLANTHSHSPMVLMRGAAEDVGIEDWFNSRIWPMEVNLTADRVRVGARLACAEMLLAGVTAFADHYFFADQIAAAATELGIRANLAPTYFSSSGERARQGAVGDAIAIRDAGSTLLTASLGPHATYTVTEKDLTYFAAAAVAEGLQIHIHASETTEQTDASRTRLGVTPIEVLERTGVLDAGVLIAHGAGIVDSDYRLLAARADRVGVACCPKGYFKHALDPMTPVRKLRDAGIRVGVGTDGAAVGNTLDVWEQTRLLALSQKRQERDPEFLTVSDAVRIATVGGASLAPFGVSGRLEVGEPADVVLVDLTGPHCQPLHDPLAALVYSMRASDVVTVVVDGRVVVRNRVLCTADLAEIVADAARVAPELLATRPGESVQHYAP